MSRQGLQGILAHFEQINALLGEHDVLQIFKAVPLVLPFRILKLERHQCLGVSWNRKGQWASADS